MSWGYWLKAWLRAWTRLLQADFFTSILVLFVPNGVDLFVFNFLEEKEKKKRMQSVENITIILFVWTVSVGLVLF